MFPPSHPFLSVSPHFTHMATPAPLLLLFHSFLSLIPMLLSIPFSLPILPFLLSFLPFSWRVSLLSLVLIAVTFPFSSSPVQRSFYCINSLHMINICVNILKLHSPRLQYRPCRIRHDAITVEMDVICQAGRLVK